jgi:hypothetical protein
MESRVPPATCPAGGERQELPYTGHAGAGHDAGRPRHARGGPEAGGGA